MIQAEVHSDDLIFSAEFDATAWFMQASEKEIIDLAGCDFGNDYPADEVAKWTSSNGNDDIEDILDYAIKVTESGGTMGFECQVDEDQAMDWLKENRKEIFDKIER